MEKNIKSCQRCNSTFECKVDNISNCQCSTIVITDHTQEFLSKTNYDCLCNKCLSELNVLSKKAAESYFPKRGNELIQNTHYYIENGNLVFTEFYHLQRGHCCKNNCRHCAYAFQR